MEGISMAQNGEAGVEMTCQARSDLYNVRRPIFTQSQFDTYCSTTSQASQGSGKNSVNKFAAKNKAVACCNASCFKSSILGLFPFLKWMRHYDLRGDLLCDVVSGLTVAIMNIPQGMAYALLANVPPVHGLYVSFFPVLVYFLMGTSRHISLGTFAVVSLMVGGVVEHYRLDVDNDVITNATAIATLPEESVSPTAVAMGVTFFVGVLQLLMGFCQLGFVTMYMSDEMVSAFTTGASFHVLTSQIKHLFGMNIKGRDNARFKLVENWVIIIQNLISETNVSALVISIISIIFMVTVKAINDIFKSKLRMPIPAELLVVIIGTLASYFGKFEAKFQTELVGDIPTGLPLPTVPPLETVTPHIGDALAIALVAFSISASMTRLFAKKHNYQVDNNQELKAYGTANILGSFFGSFASAASLSRSLVQEAVGGRTQLASLISCVVILVVLLAMAPLFEPLPTAILAAIVAVNLKGMFLQLRDLKHLWFADLVDFLIWMVTFLATVLLDVIWGLIVGVAFSILTVVVRTQKPHSYILGQVENTDIYWRIGTSKKIREIERVKIFRFEASIYFANVEFFKNKLFTLTGIDPHSLTCQQVKAEERLRRKSRKKNKMPSPIKESDNLESPFVETNVDATKSEDEEDDADVLAKKVVEPSLLMSNVAYIILDCSMMAYVDTCGAKTLLQVIREYRDIGVTVYLTSCQDGLRVGLEYQKFFQSTPPDVLHVSVHDAILYIEQQSESNACNGTSEQADSVQQTEDLDC